MKGNDDMKDEVAKLLEFGKGGHTLHYAATNDGCSSRCLGYEDPESFVQPYHWWADAPGVMKTHFDCVWPKDGVVVIDKRAAVATEAGYSWVFKGPMVDVDLPEGAIDWLGEVSTLMIPVVAAYGMVGMLSQTQQAAKEGKVGALDSVSIGQYVQGWREHGARIGKAYVRDGKCEIVWEK